MVFIVKCVCMLGMAVSGELLSCGFPQASRREFRAHLDEVITLKSRYSTLDQVNGYSLSPLTFTLLALSQSHTQPCTSVLFRLLLVARSLLNWIARVLRFLTTLLFRSLFLCPCLKTSELLVLHTAYILHSTGLS